MSWYLAVLSKYATFSGRARRKEYWMFGLISFVFTIILAVIDILIGSFSAEAGVGLLSGLYSLMVLLPGIAVMVRRMHDIGRSGWWILIGLIPFIGSIVLLIFALIDSESGSNQYGPNPKTAGAAGF